MAMADTGLVLKVHDISAFSLPDADKRPGRGTSDAYVKLLLLQADGTEFSSAQTGVIQDDRNPRWPDVVLVLPLPGNFSDCTLRVEFWDSDPGANEFMGHTKLSIDKAGAILDQFVVDGYKGLYDFRASMTVDPPMAAAEPSTSKTEQLVGLGDPPVPPLPAPAVAPPVATPAVAPVRPDTGKLVLSEVLNEVEAPAPSPRLLPPPPLSNGHAEAPAPAASAAVLPDDDVKAPARASAAALPALAYGDIPSKPTPISGAHTQSRARAPSPEIASLVERPASRAPH